MDGRARLVLTQGTMQRRLVGRKKNGGWFGLKERERRGWVLRLWGEAMAKGLVRQKQLDHAIEEEKAGSGSGHQGADQILDSVRGYPMKKESLLRAAGAWRDPPEQPRVSVTTERGGSR